MEEAKQIVLTNGLIATVSACDYERVSQYRWQAAPGNKTTYAVRSLNRRQRQFLHRFILDVTDPAIQVDHRDRNGLNNTRGNIRLCNGSQNRGNCPKPNVKTPTSKFKGVCFNRTRGKFYCHMAEQYLGSFDTEEEAARAYDAAAILKFGPDFALLNFPTDEALAKKPGVAVKRQADRSNKCNGCDDIRTTENCTLKALKNGGFRFNHLCRKCDREKAFKKYHERGRKVEG